MNYSFCRFKTSMHFLKLCLTMNLFLIISAAGVLSAVDQPQKATPMIVPTIKFPPKEQLKKSGRLVVEKRRFMNWRNRRGVDPIKGPFPPGPFPISTTIIRQYMEDRGTLRLDEIFLLDTGKRIRLVRKIQGDYFLCTSKDELTISWGVGNSEYIRTTESMGKCPGFTMESTIKSIQDGKTTGKPAIPEDQLITVETKSVKVTLLKTDWNTKGESSVLESLSFDFAKFATDDLKRLSRAHFFVHDTCETMLQGLYTLDCGGLPPPVLIPEEPNCDFDASFGEPCTTEQKRAFEDRKAREKMVAPTPLPTATPSAK